MNNLFLGTPFKFSGGADQWSYTSGIGLNHATMDCSFSSAGTGKLSKGILREASVNHVESPGISTQEQDCSNAIETGRIERAEQSEQDFYVDHSTYNILADYQIRIHLMPLSQKPISGRDMVEYCSNCGMKFKKGWKFCAKCGEKRK